MRHLLELYRVSFTSRQNQISVMLSNSRFTEGEVPSYCPPPPPPSVILSLADTLDI